MIPWLVTLGTIVLATLLVTAYRRKAQRLVEELGSEHAMQVRLLEDESDARFRRLEREAKTQQTHARDILVTDLLPIFDSLNMALETAADAEIRRGIELVQSDLLAALTRHGIDSIEPATGEPFDPELHEAAEIVAHDDLQPGTIARTLRMGLVTDDRVLRPALVTVVKAPVEASPAIPQER